MTTASILGKDNIIRWTKLPAWSENQSEITIFINSIAFKVRLIRVTKNGLALFEEV